MAPNTKVTVTSRPSSQIGTDLLGRPAHVAGRPQQLGVGVADVGLRSTWPRSTSRTRPLRTIRYSTWAVTSGLTAREGDLGSEVTDTAARLPPSAPSSHHICGAIRPVRDRCVTRSQHRYIESIYSSAMLDLAILGLLEERDLHGYEIRRQLREHLGLLANVSFGSIYPALTRLERSGAVVATEAAAPAGAPPRPRRPPRRRAPSAASSPSCGPAAPPAPGPAGQEGVPDHRRGPPAVRRAAGRRRHPRRRPELLAAPGLRPPPRLRRPAWPSSNAGGPCWSSG